MFLSVSWFAMLGIAMSVSAESDCPYQNGNRSLVTFNTGLTSQINEYKTRKNTVPQTLASSDSDVICLQEVWMKKDVSRIIDATKEKYPYSYSFLHEENGDYRDSLFNWPACSPWSLGSFSWCMFTNGCLFKSGESKLECVLANCPNDVKKLPQKCRTCLIVSSTLSCLSPFNGVNIPALLLLSKTKLTNPTRHYFLDTSIPQLFPRAYLAADVQNVGYVMCTHLTSLFSDKNDPILKKYFSSYEAQNKYEVDVLKKKVSSKPKAVVMGDFNFSPSIPANRITGEFEANYNSMLMAGFTSPYVNKVGLCTYCFNNPLRRSTSTTNNIYDHVMLKGTTAVCAQRVYRQTVDGVRLSDHEGVRVDMVPFN